MEDKMPRINKTISEIPFYLTKKISEGAASEPSAVNLSRGQAGFLPPLEIYEEAKRLIDPKDKTLFRYDKSSGSIELRKSISKWYNKFYGLDVSPEHIAITVGGTGGITLALLSLTNPGDQIIIPDPSYPFYMLSANYGLENRDIKSIFIGENRVTRKNLEENIEEKTNLVILTNPHNPNGVSYNKDTLSEIVELAKEKDFFILCDENHFPEIYDGKKHTPLALIDRKNSVVLGSLSRFALQGERIGWAILPENQNGFNEKFIAHSPFASTFAQKLATYFFNNYDTLNFDRYFKDYEEKRNWFIPQLNKFKGFQCGMPEGTSYAFPNIKDFVEENRERLENIVKEESIKRKLSNEDIDLSLKHNSILAYKFLLYEVGVGTVPGIAYGPQSDNYLRFTFSVEKGDLLEAVKRMENKLEIKKD
jgi:aspartate/methionine/tyrosine aminotransferase